MSITAKRNAVLLVDDAKVAESESPKLWDAVFDAIRREAFPKDGLRIASEELLHLSGQAS